MHACRSAHLEELLCGRTEACMGAWLCSSQVAGQLLKHWLRAVCLILYLLSFVGSCAIISNRMPDGGGLEATDLHG